MSSSAVPSRIRPAPPAAALARAALTAILAGKLSPRTAPLTVIVSADAGRLLADLGGEVHDARQLARHLARAEARGTHDRLRADLLGTGRLVIQAVDRIASPRLERGIAALLDAAATAGAVVCVSLAAAPAAAGLDASLESRLSAGLVVKTGGSPPSPPGDPRISIAAVIRTSARTLGLPIETLVGHDRHRSLVRHRGLAMYVARACTGMSLATIGRHFGGRDHTTVMRGIRGIESRLAADPALAAAPLPGPMSIECRAGGQNDPAEKTTPRSADRRRVTAAVPAGRPRQNAGPPSRPIVAHTGHRHRIVTMCTMPKHATQS